MARPASVHFAAGEVNFTACGLEIKMATAWADDIRSVTCARCRPDLRDPEIRAREYRRLGVPFNKYDMAQHIKIEGR